MMKRYIIFAFDTYYPAGGSYDIVAHIDDSEQAIEKANNCTTDNSQVYDCETEEVIWSNDKGDHELRQEGKST